MVVAGKVFRLRESQPLPSMGGKLRAFKREELFDEDPYHFKLVTEVRDLALGPESLRGMLSQDFLGYVFHHGERIPTPRTVESTFSFSQHGDRVFLTVLEKKRLANAIANLMSEILFITPGYIVEVRILPDVLRKFHEQNPEDTKIIFFDDIDIPNVEKLSLYGAGLANTDLYNSYLNHGNIWYLVATSRNYGSIVGITRNGVVTIFSKVEKSDYLNFVENEVFPLVE